MEWALWVKSLHIVAVISWMAGLLYLPRLYVYHVTSKVGSEVSETFKIMEQRLLRVIMNPAMMVTWVAGLLTGYLQDQLMNPWFHVKLVFVLVLTVVHVKFSGYRKEFERDERKRSAKFFRLMNEVPTALMIIIVLLVILKPF